MSAEPLPEFLVRGRDMGGSRIVHSDAPHVRYGAIHKTKRVVAGLFREIEQTGERKTELRIMSRGTMWATGYRRSSSHVGATVANTAAGLKTTVRRLRPQEREILEGIDAAIAEHEQAIAALREERKGVVSEAWAKAHVVRLNEIEISPWTGRTR